MKPTTASKTPREASASSDAPLLLVFTLGASCERRRRSLLPEAWGSLEESLHQVCFENVLDAGREAGCRLAVSSPLELELPGDALRLSQPGSDFGSRLDGALRRAFAETSGPVVVVGSDAPGLCADHLRRTLELLEADPEQVVIGPSPDGGFYLLASARPLGCDLATVRWCCRDTLCGLRRALHREGRRVVLLPPLADLDRRPDLERWLAAERAAMSAVWRQLRRAILSVLAALRRPLVAPETVGPRRLPLRLHRERGPPPLLAL